MIRRTALIMVIVIMVSLCPVYAREYPDVAGGTATYTAVDYLSDLGVIAGYDDGCFRPETQITRGEAAALLARSLGYTDSYTAKKMPFSDVREGYWAEKFISYCWERGIIGGMTATTFVPAEKVTYAQLVKMLVCAAGFEGDAQSRGGTNWYDGYLSVAKSRGISENVTVYPNRNAPRGDVAILVYNSFKNGYINKSSEEPPKPSVTPTPKPTATPTPKPSAVPEPDFDKSQVVSTVPHTADFKFSKVLNDYTPAVNASEVDYSGLKIITGEKKLLVAIDAGHNFSGNDTGAYNEKYDIREQYITWPIAQMLKLKLEYMGFEVVMTRNNYNDNIAGETTREVLLNRAKIANAAAADIFISIHCNAGGGSGVETYCYEKGTEGEVLAERVQNSLAEGTPLINRGVKTASFVVLKQTAMPAILVETAFIDTESDLKYLVGNDGRNGISTAIAKAVYNYANSR